MREKPKLASCRHEPQEAGYDTDLGLHGLGAASNKRASLENPIRKDALWTSHCAPVKLQCLDPEAISDYWQLLEQVYL